MTEETMPPRRIVQSAQILRRIQRLMVRLARRGDIPPSHVPLLGLGFLIALAMLVVFGSLAEDVYTRETIALDTQAGSFVHQFASPPLDMLMRSLSFIGSWPVLAALLLIAILCLLRAHRRREAVFLVLALGGGTLLSFTLKLVFRRPRPTLPWSVPEREYGFPSGHATNALILYLGLALVIWVVLGRRWGIAATLAAGALILAIGISRLYLGVHYLSDVVGGYSVGLFWLVSVAFAVEGGRRIVSRNGWNKRGRSRH